MCIIFLLLGRLGDLVGDLGVSGRETGGDMSSEDAILSQPGLGVSLAVDFTPLKRYNNNDDGVNSLNVPKIRDTTHRDATLITAFSDFSLSFREGSGLGSVL